MQVQGFEITSKSINAAFWLLSKLIGIDVGELELAASHKNDYQTIFISKQGGKRKRRLDIPSLELRHVQKKILRKCLCHITPSHSHDWDALTGYKTGQSLRSNIVPHLLGQTFLQLDLADAFPSVTTAMIRNALTVMLEEETVLKMFDFNNVRWFRRKFMKQMENPNLQSTAESPHTLDILWALREIIIWFTTFEDKLPQGAPTSPYLFNLVVANQHLPKIAQLFQGKHPFTITVYADNMTISTQDKNITPSTTEKIIRAIESQTPFRVNRKKTRLSIAKKGSPKITGLSIGKRKSKMIVTVPGEVQKRARGLLHSAIFKPEIRSQALGMLSYLLNVYGGKSKLPAQIRRPYEKLLAVTKPI